MEIEIVKITTPDSLDSTRVFGLILKSVQTHIHLLHWYAEDINVHEILGEVYESLDESFDKLQEEIIGTTKSYNAIFPSFNLQIDTQDLSQYNVDPATTINSYNDISTQLKNILSSVEFNTFVNTVCSGLNNTKEDILTILNKGSYLLSMVRP
jgi:hypothetical protein